MVRPEILAFKPGASLQELAGSGSGVEIVDICHSVGTIPVADMLASRMLRDGASYYAVTL
jgi:hypothetical protein